MCRIFAFSFKDTTLGEKRIQYIDSFRELSVSGVVLNKKNPGHQDGWGTAVYGKGSKIPCVYKSIQSAQRDGEFRHNQLFQNGIPETGIIHLRKKTVGDTSLLNTHPFVEGEYAFIHNGTISCNETYSEIAHSCFGATDSERLFRKFLTIKETEKISTLEAYKKMLKVTRSLYPEYSAINTILHDGDFVYMSRVINFENSSTLYNNEEVDEYYTLYIGHTKEGDSFVSSEKIADDDIEYTPIPNNTFCVLDRVTGKEVCSSL